MKIQSGKSDASSIAKNSDDNQVAALTAPNSNDATAGAADFLGLLNVALLLENNDDTPQGSNNELNDGEQSNQEASTNLALNQLIAPSQQIDATLNTMSSTTLPINPTTAKPSEHLAMMVMQQLRMQTQTQTPSQSTLNQPAVDTNVNTTINNFLPHQVKQEEVSSNNELTPEIELTTTIKPALTAKPLTPKAVPTTSHISVPFTVNQQMNSPRSDIATANDSFFSFNIANDISQLQTKTSQLSQLGMQHDVVAGLVQAGQFIHAQVAEHVTKNPLINMAPSNDEVDYTHALTKTQQLNANDINVQLLPSKEALARDMYHAHIKLYPPELGSVVARLKLNKNNANLEILAENNQVKAIIEANLTQLRDKFEQMNIPLVNIQVNVDDKQMAQHHQPFAAASQPDESNPITKPKTNVATAKQRDTDALVDTYA